MLLESIITEGAATELAKKLPSLKKHDYDTIDKLMRSIAKKHSITGKALHDLFVHKYKKTPDDWIKSKLDEEDDLKNIDVNAEVNKFIKWTANKLHLKTIPKIELSTDTADARNNHHTGRHTEGSGNIWIYVKNRNLVDILRTVAHELTHARQSELRMIKSGDSYPGSPIELLADMIAGKLVKIYGAKNHQIFQ